jgi:hypothetical protein
MASGQLVKELCALEDRPWREINRGGKPINEWWLAKRLREFGIEPRNIRVNESQARGYLLEDFEEVFARFLARGDG